MIGTMLSPGRQRFLLRCVLYTAAASTAFFVLSVRPGIHTFPRATFPAMITGTAHRPFVQRALMPAAVRVCVSLLPEGARERIEGSFRGKYADIAGAFHWEEGWFVERAVASLLMLGCLVGFAFGLRALVRAATPVPALLAEVTPPVVMLLLPVSFRYVGFLYDPATLLLTTLAFLALLRNRFGLFHPAFLLAAVNKETSLVLLPVFALFALKKMPRRRVVIHGTGLLLGWALIRGGIGMVYAGNPGGQVEMHFLGHNVDLVHHPSQLAFLLLAGGAAAWVVASGWKSKPLLLRRSFLATLAPLALAALFFGYVDELRVYYEVVPSATLLGVLTAARLLPPHPPVQAPVGNG